MRDDPRTGTALASGGACEATEGQIVRLETQRSGAAWRVVVAAMVAATLIAAVLAVSCVFSPAVCAFGVAAAPEGSCVITSHAQVATAGSPAGSDVFRVFPDHAVTLLSAAIPGMIRVSWSGHRPESPEPPGSADPLHGRLVI